MFNKLLAIIEETIREAKAKKTLIGFFAFSCLIILVALLIFQLTSLKEHYSQLAVNVGAPHNQHTNGKNLDLIGATLLEYIWAITSQVLLFITVCTGVFATANLMTSIMEKGAIDLLISKPVPRWLYIVGRYLGASAIMLAEVLVLVLGLWLVTGISFGAWSAKFLLSIPYMLLTFMGVYAVVALVGILTRSSALSIIVGITLYIFIGAILPLGQFLDKLLGSGGGDGAFSMIAKVIHWSLPQISDLAFGMSESIVGHPIDWLPIFATMAIIVIYGGLASWNFSKKEF